MIWLYILASLAVLSSIWTIWRLSVYQKDHAWHTAADPNRATPSVSVCIPARNEAHGMSFCLERVLASDYEKLEILVLDDHSDDDTSLLIKSFAHAGVRFIPGKPLPEGWLGKNHALDTMAREASGDLIIFLDVDTQIERHTISHLAGRFEKNKSSVMSVMPQRRDTGRASVLFGHLRYFWEIILSTSRMPVSSSALWIIRRDTLLEELNGFNGIHDHVQPERALASWASQHNAYQSVVSRPELGVYYEKRWSSQRETSQRLLLPLLSSSIYSVLVGVGSLAIWLSSIVVTLLAVLYPAAWPCAAIMIVSGAMSYYCYLHVAWSGRQLLGVLFWPYIIVQEVWFATSSVIRYATKTVTWKGRPVRAPGLNRHYLILDE